MSNSEAAPNQGPPPFEPSIEKLSALSDSIQASLAQYASASTPQEKASALKALQTSSSRLSTATSPIQQRFMDLNSRPYLNVTVRLAFELKLFEALPNPGSITLSELSSSLNASEEFIFRLVRVLGAFEVLDVTYPPPNNLLSVAHTPFSQFLLSPAAKASSRNHFEILLPAHLASVPGYFHKYGFQSPQDFKNVPFTFAHGAVDEDFFDLLVKDEAKLTLFNNAMTIMAVLGLKPLGSLYPFDKLVPNQDGIALVDIGGGKGQMLKVIQEAYPATKGKLVLEDLQVVLKGGVVVDQEVKLLGYDFFKEVQPIKGSNYFLKSIFHDWPDKACLAILSNLAPAMRGHPHSKLLICELVLPDQHPEPTKVIRDITMLLIGGSERNLTQWNTLLKKGGFKIVNVHGAGGENSSIIEAVLDE
ncbi:S-adenosyl-L-methionine-dependent methyltransferase [Stipitochalara longipes BDJ]|nr:S-adenosyl-L-methionine-dependent methyltransferase [Stipitochalara longipes BDJ]